MNGPARGKKVLIAEVGADAVTKLVEKYGEDAVLAVFVLQHDNQNLTVADAFEHTMECYQGTWEHLSEYLATNLQEKIDEALKEYGEKHNFNWPIKIHELTQMNWADIADYAEDNYYYALPTGLDDLEKAYFIFEIPSYSSEQ